MKKEVIPNESPAKVWPRAVKAGNHIYVATAGIDDDGKSVGPEFEEQLDYIFSDMKKTLESLGSSMDNLVEMTIYMVDLARDNEKIGPVWGKYIKSMPMVASIGTTQLMPLDPPLLVEVTATAIIED